MDYSVLLIIRGMGGCGLVGVVRMREDFMCIYTSIYNPLLSISP